MTTSGRITAADGAARRLRTGDRPAPARGSATS